MPPMTTVPFPDSSFLTQGNDNTPGVRFSLIASGVPVEETEKQAALRSGAGCAFFDCPLGFAAFHYGNADQSKNGWSFALANRADSMAADAAVIALHALKAHETATMKMGVAQ